MAFTSFGSLSLAQKRLWATDVSKAGRDQNFWMSNGFVGKDTADMTRPVHRITELTKTERGLSAVMQLVADLRGDGVAGDNQLSGNEETILNDAIVIQIDQLRNGVRSKGAMAEQATVLRFRTVGRDVLAFWLADTLDELMFLTVAGRAYTLTTGGATRGASSRSSLSPATSPRPRATGRSTLAPPRRPPR